MDYIIQVLGKMKQDIDIALKTNNWSHTLLFSLKDDLEHILSLVGKDVDEKNGK